MRHEKYGDLTIVDSPGRAEFLPLPDDSHCTSICFGGRDLKKAYVTHSHIDRLLEFDWPRAGLRFNYSVHSG